MPTPAFRKSHLPATPRLSFPLSPLCLENQGGFIHANDLYRSNHLERDHV
jgi:hypothetical protein